MTVTAPSYEMTLKDALAHAGLLDKSKTGKGRPSREMIENAQRLVAEHGYFIKGFSTTGTAPVDKSDNKSGKTVKSVKHVPLTNNAKVVSEITYTYPEASWEACAVVNGKEIEVSMRECCTNCYRLTGQHTSLVGHVCQSPSVSTVVKAVGLETPVVIRPRTKPLKQFSYYSKR